MCQVGVIKRSEHASEGSPIDYLTPPNRLPSHDVMADSLGTGRARSTSGPQKHNLDELDLMETPRPSRSRRSPRLRLEKWRLEEWCEVNWRRQKQMRALIFAKQLAERALAVRDFTCQVHVTRVRGIFVGDNRRTWPRYPGLWDGAESMVCVVCKETLHMPTHGFQHSFMLIALS